MRVLVCGSRTLTNHWPIWTVLQGFYEMESIGYLTVHANHLIIITGGAPGADTIARQWAETPGPHPAAEGFPDVMSVFSTVYPADWDKYGKRAGPIRNNQMLKEGKPDQVVAFYDGVERTRGTTHMVDISRKALVPVWEIFI